MSNLTQSEIDSQLNPLFLGWIRVVRKKNFDVEALEAETKQLGDDKCC